MRLYWQSKIFALLHDPVFKPFYTDKSIEGLWRKLAVMQDFQDIPSSEKLLAYLKNADQISAASDRASINSIKTKISYDHQQGLEISHLLSGAKQHIRMGDHQVLISKEQDLFNAIEHETDPKKVFWWLWRCLPTEACNDPSLFLMPADPSIPDASLWSHTSMTAAIAGASIGYQTTSDEIDQIAEKDLWYKYKSHPYLVTFSFAPVQDLIKSSRKLGDFWAGSWILHYLSAKVSWVIAKKYGADSLLYPSLFHQPLIDLWLLKEYPDFSRWVKTPSTNSLLTAGFPNVLVLVLPQAEVAKAMQTAKQELGRAWKELSNLVLTKVGWGDDILATANCWDGWLDTQWQSYWTGLPIGNTSTNFKQSQKPPQNPRLFMWMVALNKTYGLENPNFSVHIKDDAAKEILGLFRPAELNFLPDKTNPNIGSWWGYIFDNTRLNLAAVKNARNWQLPTVFSTRSTVSGIGAAVHDRPTDWAKAESVKVFWSRENFLFNQSEQLNATEVVKRGLQHILPELLGRDDLEIAYLDLTSGVAGYLKTHPEVADYYRSACQKVLDRYPDRLTDNWQKNNKWGIPWAEISEHQLQRFPPRLLNAGLVEDLGIDANNIKVLQESRSELNHIISQSYPQNNPTDWYVLAAGDGDGMSEWLKGEKLATYDRYVHTNLIPLPKLVELQELIDQERGKLGKLTAEALAELTDEQLEKVIQPRRATEFLELDRRMGPSTHNALSRALLDFSNQLVPHLTETRYAGRLIYAGGDDVLACTNLWEWDSWLWDIRQCFRGDRDPQQEFNNDGDYWQWNDSNPSLDQITSRPLFTMGNNATISFGIAIAHQSIPLAITLEHLWAAAATAKTHQSNPCNHKDAVQVRLIYQNGNILSATAKFTVFNYWRKLLATVNQMAPKLQLDALLFEQAATAWEQHSVPNIAAVKPWCRAFCARRAVFEQNTDSRQNFEQVLGEFMTELINNTQSAELDAEMRDWFKLAAFTLRRRKIELRGEELPRREV